MSKWKCLSRWSTMEVTSRAHVQIRFVSILFLSILCFSLLFFFHNRLQNADNYIKVHIVSKLVFLGNVFHQLQSICSFFLAIYFWGKTHNHRQTYRLLVLQLFDQSDYLPELTHTMTPSLKTHQEMEYMHTWNLDIRSSTLIFVCIFSFSVFTLFLGWISNFSQLGNKFD